MSTAELGEYLGLCAVGGCGSEAKAFISIVAAGDVELDKVPVCPWHVALKSADPQECGICSHYTVQGVEVHDICLNRLRQALTTLIGLEGTVFASDPKARPMLAQSVVRKIARVGLGQTA